MGRQRKIPAILIMENKKNYELEVLRVAAFIAVFTQHLLGAYARRNDGFLGLEEEYMISSVFEFCRFAVPTFVLLFGLLMIKSYKPNTTYLAYLIKRFKQIIIPFLVASIVYLFYNEQINLSSLAAAKELVINIIKGKAAYHLWYVPMIFQFVILAPVVFLFKKWVKDKKINGKGLLCIFVCFMLSCLTYLHFAKVFNLGQVFAGYTRIFPTWLIYFGVGAFIGLDYDKAKEIVLKLFPYAAAVSVISITYAIFKDLQYINQFHKVSFNKVNFLEPVYAVATICQIITLFAIALKLKILKKFTGFFLFVGENSYMAYLLHVWFLSKISLLLLEHVPELNLIYFYGILYISALGLTLLISYLVNYVILTINNQVISKK